MIKFMARYGLKNMRIFLAITLTFLTGFSHAQKIPPAELDLRASYCFAALSKGLEDLKSFNFIPPEYLSETKDNRDRVYRYLVGRVRFFDSNGLSAIILARQHYFADHLIWKEAVDNKCGKLDNFEILDCVRDIGDTKTNLKNITNRFTLCNDLSWLPF